MAASDLLDKLNQSIEATTQDPLVPLEQRTFEEAELVLAESLNAEQKQQLLVSLSGLVPKLQQDPTPAVDLLLRLIRDYSYGDILQLGSIPFTDGLAVGDHMTSFNRVIIAILQKATDNAADAASVAGLLDTVQALVRLWLTTNDTGVASAASRLLLDLLRVDQEVQQNLDCHIPSGGQGLVWKRIFNDRNVYRQFFETSSLTGPSSVTSSKGQRTLAQARLMEWLPQVARMDWNAVSKTHHPEIEAEYKVQGGLLDYATLHMVDTKDDVLMYRCLIDFYSDILDSTKANRLSTGENNTETLGLTYLIARGVHASTAAIYLQLPGAPVDPLESMFLYGPAANYIATYASSYPKHFLASQMPAQVLNRLSTALDMSPAKWAHAESPKHDLHLLASLPRKALLPDTGGASWSSSPLPQLPSKATNPDVLNTLAAIFHGPNTETVYNASTSQAKDLSSPEEASYAGALYYAYVSSNPRFWSDIATHADTVALKDLALSALNVLLAVITANWSSETEVALPSNIATPASGHLALLSPPALEYALPYLLSPAKTFANLVGGRGDAESSAYKISSAKFDCLTALAGRLERQVQVTPGEGYEDILATLNKRLAEGPLSREGEIGGRIGTLEL